MTEIELLNVRDVCEDKDQLTSCQSVSFQKQVYTEYIKPSYCLFPQNIEDHFNFS